MLNSDDDWEDMEESYEKCNTIDSVDVSEGSYPEIKVECINKINAKYIIIDTFSTNKEINLVEVEVYGNSLLFFNPTTYLLYLLRLDLI